MENQEQNQPQPYISQDGFVNVRVLRGFTEITILWGLLGDITQHRSFICGGYARYMCSPKHKPESATDVDIYSQNQEDFDALKNIFTGRYALEVNHENDVSLTFKIPKDNDLQYCQVIQLIKPENKGAIVAAGDMQIILSNFDFTVVRVGLVSPTQALADADFLHDEKNGLLRLKNIHCPISSILRCMKYSRKGYFLKPSQAFKLFADWDARDEEYRAKIASLIRKSEEQNMTQKEIDQLEALMRID